MTLEEARIKYKKAAEDLLNAENDISFNKAKRRLIKYSKIIRPSKKL